MNNALVSVIIPCYNVEKYLDRCLNTVVAQTYENLEIILVDDGSTDGTPALCDEWAEKDKRIKVIHKQNDGLANARNSGIEFCTGDYVLFVDSDDFADEDIVEFLLNLSVKYNADVSRCGFYINEDERDRPAAYKDEVQILDRDERFIDLIDGSYISGVAWNKLYTKKVIKSHPYSKADGCSEDILHNYRVYKDIDKTVFYDVPKYHYCINNNSITKSVFSKGAFDIIRARKIFLNDFKDNKTISKYAQKWLVISSFIVLSGCIQNDMFKEEALDLRKDILKYKKQIFFTNDFSFKDKIKTFVLLISPKLYCKIIKSKG